MDVIKLIFVTIFLYVNFIPVKEALDCYSCGDTTENGLCQTSILEMEAAFQQYHHENDTEKVIKSNPLLKQCHGNWNTNCVIQQAIRAGKTTAYIRDCSDGNTFISGSKQGIVADNQTSFYFDKSSETVFKIQLCNDSLCNGPNPEPINQTVYDASKNIENSVCYSCIDTTDSGECKTNIRSLEETYKKYTNASRKIKDTSSSTEPKKYMKCIGKGEMCMILDISKNGKTQFYIRHCTDGVKIPYGDNLGSRLSDNTTRCALDTSTVPGRLVCLTLCRGKLCNGPNPNSASHTGYGIILIFLSLILSVMCKFKLS